MCNYMIFVSKCFYLFLFIHCLLFDVSSTFFFFAVVVGKGCVFLFFPPPLIYSLASASSIFIFFYFFFFFSPVYICCVVFFDRGNFLIHILLILREMFGQNFHLLCGSLFHTKTLTSFLDFPTFLFV